MRLASDSQGRGVPRLPILVTPNEYLDARRREWADAEVLGEVRYSVETRLVSVMSFTIAEVLTCR